MKEIKKQSFMEGAAVLVVAHLAVKIIGACFKIPLANILHETGMAYFTRAYNLYAALFVMATAGLPVAVSKMVSESRAKQNYGESKKILRASIVLLCCIGAIGMLAMIFAAKPIAENMFSSSGSYFSIIAIAPALFFIAVLSAFRGYFQGHSNMVPTAYSEVIEAFCKLIIGLSGAYFLMRVSVEAASAGAVLGVTLGGFFALLFLLCTHLKGRKNTPNTNLTDIKTTGEIYATLLKIAIPITIGSAVMSLTNVIDTFMISNRLQSITIDERIASTLTSFFGITGEKLKIGEKIAGECADVIYGSYSGYAMSLFNLPPSIVTSISMSIVPAISSALALKKSEEAKVLCQSSIRITTLFALPCALGLSVLSSPILITLYNNARAQDTLCLLSLSIVFVCIVSVSTSILQASGHVLIPVRNMLIGGIYKCISNYVLIGIPALNIGGAPISTFGCYLIIALLNLWSLKCVVHSDFKLSEFVIKPLVSSLIMAVVAFLTYNLSAKILGCPIIDLKINFLPAGECVTPVVSAVRLKIIISLGISIVCAVIAYVAAVFITRAFKREDIEMLPKGNKIVSFMERKNLL